SHPPRLTLFPYTTLFRSAERNPSRCSRKDEFAARIDAVDERVEAAADERVVDGADGQQQLAVELVAEAELAEQHEQVHLADAQRSEEHTSELQSLAYLVC